MEIITRDEAIDRGLGRYFTGQKCKNGHVDHRNTLSGTCLGCVREAQAALRARRKAKMEKLAGAA
jgi:hypothetical protein